MRFTEKRPMRKDETKSSKEGMHQRRQIRFKQEKINTTVEKEQQRKDVGEIW